MQPPPVLDPSPSKPAPVTFGAAFAFWLKLGFISFGGPSGQIAIMHTELVERRRWISERRFLHALNYCMLLPGPEAQQLATYIGWLLHGTRGGLVAGALFVLPSLVILIALAWIYMAYGSLPLIAGVLDGMKPAVVAIVAFAAYRIGSRVLTTASAWAAAGASFIALYLFAVPFPYVIAGAALAGFAIGRIAPGLLRSKPVAHVASSNSAAHALIDDADVAPAHARFRWSRAIATIVCSALLWLAALAVLMIGFGADSPFLDMGLYFTKAAFLTFGGAYAVLPYVQQAAVEQYRWLTADQMIDGLALGETTPGPLIMVVAFVGFVGGWTHAPGELAAPLAAIVAACVATFFTFLPSFVFIFVGAPMIEATRDELSFTAPLTMITAAVVGVIFNLALYFAEHVLWPAGTVSLRSLDVFAALLCIIAFVALLRFKANVVLVIGACALAGFVRVFVKQ